MNRPGTVREFSEIINDPRLEIPSVASVMAVSDVPVTIPWDLERPNAKRGCPDTYRWDLTLATHLDGSDPNKLQFEITLVPAPPLGTPLNSWFVPEHRRAHTTFAVANQQTIVLGGFGKRRLDTEQSMLVLTPYLIRSDTDLRRLFECKVRQAQGAIGRDLQ